MQIGRHRHRHTGADVVVWGRTYPGVGDLELPEDVLGHVVLGHGVHHEVLVAGRALGGPVLVALLLHWEGREDSVSTHSPMYQVSEQTSAPLIQCLNIHFLC